MKTFDHDLFNYTSYKLAEQTESGLGRLSGGMTITSDFALHRHKNYCGFTKTIINGITFVNVYFNDEGIKGRDRLRQ